MLLTPEHLASLYEEHGPELLRYLVRRTFDPEAAFDLLGDTFTTAIVERRRFRGSTREEALGWLYSIAKNKLVDQARRGRSERAALSRVAHQRVPLDEDEYEQVERLLDAHELRDAVAIATDELSEEHHEILRLRVVEERTFRELAADIGISEQTARARLSRALRALRSTPAVIQLREELPYV